MQEQLVDPVGGMVGYSLKNVFKPRVGFDAVYFAGAE